MGSAGVPTLVEMNEERPKLEVSEYSLAVGPHSVGIPFTRTGDQVVEAYLELITLVRAQRPTELRGEDIDVLESETGFERAFIENRVNAHLEALR